MIAVVQRAARASVTVAAESYRAEIGPGLVILLGVEAGDGEAEIAWGAAKCANLRIFKDDEEKMNRSVKDLRGEALVVSQFTLAGDCRKGNRPSFIKAAPPELAKPLYERFCELLEKEHGVPVKRGIFQAMMQVELVNDGPVTLLVQKRAGETET
ncbi:MAG: D-aminoacyl-tRNA deacylase [Planctomycetota bacterium]|nr:D-aminoacyl-tRNA deacylase [Planctomycetota bacterium]